MSTKGQYEAEWEALKCFADNSSEGCLVICIGPAGVRERLVADLRHTYGEAADLYVPDAPDQPYAWREQTRPIVVIHGLSKLMSAARRKDFCFALNMGRDQIALAAATVVFWCENAQTYRELRSWAPDFAVWSSHTAQFAPDDVAPGQRANAEGEYLDHLSQTYELLETRGLFRTADQDAPIRLVDVFVELAARPQSAEPRPMPEDLDEGRLPAEATDPEADPA